MSLQPQQCWWSFWFAKWYFISTYFQADIAFRTIWTCIAEMHSFSRSFVCTFSFLVIANSFVCCVFFLLLFSILVVSVVMRRVSINASAGVLCYSFVLVVCIQWQQLFYCRLTENWAICWRSFVLFSTEFVFAIPFKQTNLHRIRRDEFVWSFRFCSKIK